METYAVQNPCVKLFRVGHDWTAGTVAYTRDRQPIEFPTLDSAHTVAEMLGNLFPTGQYHGASILAHFRALGLCHTILMAGGDKAHDNKARTAFNQKATESLQNHRNDLAHNVQVASDADVDVQKRKRHRRKRAEDMREADSKRVKNRFTSK